MNSKLQLPEYLQAKLSDIKPTDYKSVLEFIVEQMQQSKDAMLLDIMEKNGVPVSDFEIVEAVKKAMVEYGDVCERSLDVGVLSRDDIENWIKNTYQGSMHDHVQMIHDFQFFLAKRNKEWRNNK